MKKSLFLLILGVMTWQLQAQRISLIPRVGYNYSTITSTDKVEPRDGINAGLGIDVKISHLLSIETGGYFSMQGSSYPFFNNSDALNFDLINNYINVPLLLKCYLIKGLHLSIGPQIGFLAHSKHEFSSHGRWSKSATKRENHLDRAISMIDLGEADYIAPIDISGVIGIGYQFDFGLILSTNWNIGLTDILKKEDSEIVKIIYPKQKTMRNNVIQLNLGWRF